MIYAMILCIDPEYVHLPLASAFFAFIPAFSMLALAVLVLVSNFPVLSLDVFSEMSSDSLSLPPAFLYCFTYLLWH